MNKACVIGNGTSRLQLDLAAIGRQMTTYGCNALYRDYMPKHITAIDYAMLDELVVKNKVYERCTIHTEVRGNYTIIDPYVQYITTGYGKMFDAGNLAVLVASQLKEEVIYMIGFDYIRDEHRTNNVYRDTRNYKDKNFDSHPEQLVHEWIRRMKYIVRKYPNTQYIRVNGNDYIPNITEPNYKNITLNEFNNKLKETNDRIHL